MGKGKAWNEEAWPRALACVCGWTGRAVDVTRADRMAAAHVADGCEGVDHVIEIELYVPHLYRGRA